jgi:hypothetical protein
MSPKAWKLKNAMVVMLVLIAFLILCSEEHPASQGA